MEFEPTADTVLIRREVQKTYEGADGSVLEMPENQWTYKMYGVIVAAGPGMLRPHRENFLDPDDELESGINPDRYPMQYKVGDTVLCPPNLTMIPADPLNPTKDTLFYCSERQLIAKLTQDTPTLDGVIANGHAVLAHQE